MKKIISVIIVIVLLVSCAPKRMKCYGKRCVEVSKKDTKPVI
jgi:hypothetical protein